jgi:hypothetical protein
MTAYGRSSFADMEALADTSLLFPCSQGNPASARIAC